MSEEKVDEEADEEAQEEVDEEADERAHARCLLSSLPQALSPANPLLVSLSSSKSLLFLSSLLSLSLSLSLSLAHARASVSLSPLFARPPVLSLSLPLVRAFAELTKQVERCGAQTRRRRRRCL